MFRKLMLALGATVALAGAALTPTTASAWHPHGHHHHWHGKYWGFGPGYYSYAGSDCYVVPKVVYTPWGPRKRYVTVCN